MSSSSSYLPLLNCGRHEQLRKGKGTEATTASIRAARSCAGALGPATVTGMHAEHDGK